MSTTTATSTTTMSVASKAAQMCSDYQYLFKIVVVGECGVGKTSLLLRYIDDTFTSNWRSTTGVDFKIKTLEVANEGIVKLQVWDTSGQSRFRCLVSTFYRGGHGVVVVFDVTDMESFCHVEEWFKEAVQFGNEDASRLLIGNKSDLTTERVVSFDMAQDLANKMGIPYIETSAKDTTNVEKAFVSLAHTLVEFQKTNPRLLDPHRGTNVSIKIGKKVPGDPRRFKCC